jgi:hypothetical protein
VVSATIPGQQRTTFVLRCARETNEFWPDQKRKKGRRNASPKQDERNVTNQNFAVTRSIGPFYKRSMSVTLPA